MTAAHLLLVLAACGVLVAVGGPYFYAIRAHAYRPWPVPVGGDADTACVYRAETAWRQHIARSGGRRFYTGPSAERYVRKTLRSAAVRDVYPAAAELADEIGVEVLPFAVLNGGYHVVGASNAATTRIVLTKSGAQPCTLLHETAHLLTAVHTAPEAPDGAGGCAGEAGHGPEFRAVMLALVGAAFGGGERDRLAGMYSAAQQAAAPGGGG